MPGHKHVPLKQSVPDQKSPIAAIWADTRGRTAPHIYNDSANMTTMNEQAMQRKGGGQPHNNMQPYLGLSFIIALEGIYPNRS